MHLVSVSIPISRSVDVSEFNLNHGSRFHACVTILYPSRIDVHPNDVCEKLGPRYASIPASELNKHHNFYKDLLRYLRNYLFSCGNNASRFIVLIVF